jgi:3-phenylpropionate/trans-cinnamate dioxygenase ferredoxin reductase subunit
VLRAVVILGGGQAGARAAQALRRLGYEGVVHIVGAEPHLPYQRPPLSKEFLTAGGGEEALTLGGTPAWHELAAIFDPDTTALEVDTRSAKVALSDGRALAYDALIVATGARPRRLSIAGLGDEDVLYLRNLDDARRLRERLEPGRRLCVVGAGVIGLEIAATAQMRGLEVTLVEKDEEPLGRIVPAPVGAFMRKLHEDAGSVFQCGVVPVRGERVHSSYLLHLSDGTKIEADTIVAGIGVVPNVEPLTGTGLALADGVLTDAVGRTANPAIFAVGDVARSWRPLLGRAVRLESWRNAEDQPSAAAAALMGNEEPYDAVPWMWSDQLESTIQVAGTPLEGDSVVERAGTRGGTTLFYLKSGTLVGGITIDQSRDMRWIQRLIGARARLDPACLADPSLSLSDLARHVGDTAALQ